MQSENLKLHKRLAGAFSLGSEALSLAGVPFVWFLFVSFLGALTVPAAWASVGGGSPAIFVDIARPEAEDFDGDGHFKTLTAALQAPLGEYTTVLVEPGRYEGDLVIAVEGLTLRSARGAAQTVIVGQVRIEARHVRIEGFSIEGPPDRPAVVITPQGGSAVLATNRIYGADVGVRIEEAGGVTLQGNQIYNHARDGVIIQGAWSVTLRENELRGNGGSGLWAKGTQDLLLVANEIAQNKLGGIWLSGAQRARIANNTLQDNDLLGLMLEGVSESLVEGNRVVAGDAGILLLEAVGNEVRGNEIQGQRVVGLGLKNGAQGNVVERNTIQGNQGREAVGVRLSGSVLGNAFRENMIVENSLGVMLSANETGGPLGNVFEGNEIARSDGAGVRIGPQVRRNRFIANAIHQNLDEGIVSAGLSDIYEKNEIYENGRAGIALRGARDARLAGNAIYANGDVGVRLEQASGVVLSENEIQSNMREGLVIAGGERLRLLSNAITGNGGSGLVAQGVQTLVLEKNELQENVELGALFTDVKGLAADGNVIAANGAGGVQLVRAVRADFEANRFEDNLHFGLRVLGGERISARRNFWGDVQGPAGAFAGSGDAVLGLSLEDVTPWLPAGPDELMLSSLSAAMLDAPPQGRLKFDATDRLGLTLEIYNADRSAPQGLIVAARYAERPEDVPPLPMALGFYAITVEGVGEGTAVLTLFYREEDEPLGLDPEKLRIFVLRDGKWVPLPGRADPILQRVTGEIPLNELSGRLLGLGMLTESQERELEPSGFAPQEPQNQSPSQGPTPEVDEQGQKTQDQKDLAPFSAPLKGGLPPSPPSSALEPSPLMAVLLGFFVGLGLALLPFALSALERWQLLRRLHRGMTRLLNL
jgi:parallel beta-helix repeat protein